MKSGKPCARAATKQSPNGNPVFPPVGKVRVSIPVNEARVSCPVNESTVSCPVNESTVSCPVNESTVFIAVIARSREG